MGVEIERKFLVCGDAWRDAVVRVTPITQGYFCRTPVLRARVRLYGDRGFITMKGQPGELVRDEFEYEVPRDDALMMLDRFKIEPLIMKTRHDVTFQGMAWSVDEFEGDNVGLVLAEVELEHPAQQVALPFWVGEEVTTDRRYGNSYLANSPYSTWM